MTAPTASTTLAALTQQRILDLARVFGVRMRGGASKKQLADLLGAQLEGRLPALFRELGREELQATSKAHDLHLESAVRRELIDHLLQAAGVARAATEAPPPPARGALPAEGQIVRARHRQWMVEAVYPGGQGESPRLALVCLDDDDPGRRLDVLWDLELGLEPIEPGKRGLGAVDRIDAPDQFGAYLHALRWNAVSAADATRFQAPFRAGIEHMAHQLTPLMKALELPRANLFIADDVGLGKTIEAGLVMQELVLRQQAHFILIACPASICLQWQTEMRRRFGLQFEVMTRSFVANRRRQRGFGVNPWATHHRFIVSHALLRRPEYLEPLLQMLGDRAHRSLFVLDEAHVAAPATRSHYAVDSETTKTVRNLAPKFDNRLFLSATPHNGHSNSFSALLEILDPIRFSRGVPVQGKTDLAPIMVRRLKRDLKKLGIDSMPERVLVQIDLSEQGQGWRAEGVRSDGAKGWSADLGEAPLLDLELARDLAQYTALCAPKKGPKRLPFIRLQQRLLSSPEAFARSLEVHIAAVERTGGVAITADALEDGADPELYGETDEILQAEADAALARESRELEITAAASELLHSMRRRAERARRTQDGKMRALIAWLREHLCPAIGEGPDTKASRSWSPRRVIIFTEWADTKRYVRDLLREAIADTDNADDRIATFSGGLGEEAREELQRRFNDEHDPLRILIATDAAREGLNLQAQCADLFHIDLPWNPARLEQRNGRIDRTLQPSPEVRCHYFVYTAREEDRVLATLVKKIDVMQRELGSLGGVLLDTLEIALEGGIRSETAAAIDSLATKASKATVSELEAARENEKQLREEISRAGKRYDQSRRLLEVSPESLQHVVDIGLRLAGTSGLAEDGAHEGKPRFKLPELDRSWAVTLDTLRPARARDESFYDWRTRAPLPVTFSPLGRLTSEIEQLHLAHPLTKRILDRFLAQGFSAHDLRRVSAVVHPTAGEPQVFAYARLTLFGQGAARLHDEIFAVGATWDGAVDTASALVRRTDKNELEHLKSTEGLLAAGSKPVGPTIADAVALSAPQLLGALWSALENEADSRGTAAKNGLAARARAEADGMRDLLLRQRRALQDARKSRAQEEMFHDAGDSADVREQRRQHDLDLEHMNKRQNAIESELESEPKAIEALYDVRMTRITPVGVVVAWPRSWS